MDQSSLAARLSALADEAQDLADAIQEGGGPENRARRHAHRLRSHFGVGLVLAERLARESGNKQMLTYDPRDDAARVCYSIALDETEIIDVEMQ